MAEDQSATRPRPPGRRRRMPGPRAAAATDGPVVWSPFSLLLPRLGDRRPEPGPPLRTGPPSRAATPTPGSAPTKITGKKVLRRRLVELDRDRQVTFLNLWKRSRNIAERE